MRRSWGMIAFACLTDGILLWIGCVNALLQFAHAWVCIEESLIFLMKILMQ